MRHQTLDARNLVVIERRAIVSAVQADQCEVCFLGVQMAAECFGKAVRAVEFIYENAVVQLLRRQDTAGGGGRSACQTCKGCGRRVVLREFGILACDRASKRACRQNKARGRRLSVK